jgi:hypothetical protein
MDRKHSKAKNLGDKKEVKGPKQSDRSLDQSVNKNIKGESMRRTNKLLIFLAVAAVLLFLPLAASADTIYVLNEENSGATFPSNPTPFGEVIVHLVDSTHANITYTTLAPSPLSLANDAADAIPSYTFWTNQAVDAHVNASATFSGNTLTAVGFTVSSLASFDDTGAASGSMTWDNPAVTPINNGGQRADSFGHFTLIIEGASGTSAGDPDKVTFTLTRTDGGSWASDASVFTNNEDGFPVAAHLYADFNNGRANGNTFFAVPGPVPGSVPVPPSVFLMGSGLLGMGLRSFRRKIKV